MSETEIIKGKLIPIQFPNESLEHACERMCWEHGVTNINNDYIDGLREELYEKFIILKNKLYIFDKRIEIDPNGFSEVTENTDGSIDFFCMWYNGGASLEEVIEGDLSNESAINT